MLKGMNKTRSALAAALLLGVVPSLARASDLTTYRDFRFGSDVATVGKPTGVDASRGRCPRCNS
jgi:hypothetical protein